MGDDLRGTEYSLSPDGEGGGVRGAGPSLSLSGRGRQGPSLYLEGGGRAQGHCPLPSNDGDPQAKEVGIFDSELVFGSFYLFLINIDYRRLINGSVR